MPVAVLLPDPQWPFEDKSAWQKAIQTAVALQPQELILLGDCFDFPSISKYQGHPELCSFVKYHIDYGREKLKQIEDFFPRTKLVFIEGNHEFRFERFMRSVPQLYGMLDFKVLTGLDLPMWTFVPYKPMQGHRILGIDFIARHEPLGASAKASALNALCCHVYGHKHQIEYECLRGLLGNELIAFSPGWLGDPTQEIFSFAAKILHKWKHGVGVLNVGRSFKAEIIEI